MDNRPLSNTSASPPQPSSYGGGGGQPALNMMPPSYRGNIPPPAPLQQQYQPSSQYHHQQYGTSIHQQPQPPLRGGMLQQFSHPPENMQWPPMGHAPSSIGQQQLPPPPMYGHSSQYPPSGGFPQPQPQHTIHHRGPAPPSGNLYSAPSPQRILQQHHQQHQQRYSQQHMQPQIYGDPQQLSSSSRLMDDFPSPYSAGSGSGSTHLPITSPQQQLPRPPPYYSSGAAGVPPPPPSHLPMQSSLYSSFQPGMPPIGLTHQSFRPQQQHFIPQQQMHATGFPASSDSVGSMGLYGNPSVTLSYSASSLPLPPTSMHNFPLRFPPPFASSSNAHYSTSFLDEQLERTEADNFNRQQQQQQVVTVPTAAAAADYFAYLNDVRSSSSRTAAKRPKKLHAFSMSDEEHASNNRPHPPSESSSSTLGASEVVSLAELLDVALQTIYTDFGHLMGRMPLLHAKPVDKKICLVEFCWRSRSYMIRFYAAYDWASTSISKVLKCGRLVKYLADISDTHLETADFLSQLARETLALTKLSSYQIPIAVDVLSAGAFSHMPKCLRTKIIESNRYFNESLEISRGLNDFSPNFVESLIKSSLRTKFIQRNVLPDHLRMQSVEFLSGGVAKVEIPGEFQLSLTVDSIQDETAYWKIVELKILVVDFNISGGGSGALCLIPDSASRTLSSTGCVAPKQVEFLREVLQEILSPAKKTNPTSLVAVYDFLHEFCVNLKFDILLTQLLQLEELMTAEEDEQDVTADLEEDIHVNIFTVMKYDAGRSVTINYWGVSGNLIFPDEDSVDDLDEADEILNETDEEFAETSYSITFSYKIPNCGKKCWRIEHFPSFFDSKNLNNRPSVESFDVDLDMNRFMTNLLYRRCLEKLSLLKFTLEPWFACIRLHAKSEKGLISASYVEIAMLAGLYTSPAATSPTFSPARSFRIFVHQFTGMYFVSRHHLPTVLHQFGADVRQKVRNLLKKLEICLNRAFCVELVQQNNVVRQASFEPNVGTDEIIKILLAIEKSLLKGSLIMYCQSLGLSPYLPSDDVRPTARTCSTFLLSGRSKTDDSDEPTSSETLFFRILECEHCVIVLNLMTMEQHIKSHMDVQTIIRLEQLLPEGEAEHVRQQLQPSLAPTNLRAYNNRHVHAEHEIPRLAAYSITIGICVLEHRLPASIVSGDLLKTDEFVIPFLLGVMSAGISIPACAGCSTFSSFFLNRLEAKMSPNDKIRSHLPVLANTILVQNALKPTVKQPTNQIIPWSQFPRAMPGFVAKHRQGRIGKEVFDEKQVSQSRHDRRTAIDQRLKNFGKQEGICLSCNLYETGTGEATDSPVSRTSNMGTEMSHVLSSCVEHMPFFEIEKALIGRGFTLAQPFTVDGRGGGGTALTGKRGIHTLELVRFPPAEDYGEVQFHRVFRGAMLSYVPRTTRILDPIPVGMYLITLRFSNLLYYTTDVRKSPDSAVLDKRKMLLKTMQRWRQRNPDHHVLRHGSQKTLMVSLNYQATHTSAEASARVVEDLENDFRAMAKIYGFLYTWYMYDKALHGISDAEVFTSASKASGDKADFSSAEKFEWAKESIVPMSDPLVRSILSTVEVKHYDVANLSFCYRVAPLFTPPRTSSTTLTARELSLDAASRNLHTKNGGETDAGGEIVAGDDDAVANDILSGKSTFLPTGAVSAEQLAGDKTSTAEATTTKSHVSLASLFLDSCAPSSAADAETSLDMIAAAQPSSPEYEMHLSWDSRLRTFNVGLRCAAVHGIGTNPHLVIRDLLSQQLEAACSMRSEHERERVWTARQYCTVVDMLYNLSVTIRPITLLGALACRSPLIQYDPRIDFAYTAEAGRTPGGATNPTRGWYNHSPYRMRPLKPNVYRLEMCKRMRLLFVVDQYGRVLVGDEGLPIYCAYKRRKLARIGASSGEVNSFLNRRKSFMQSLLDDDDDEQEQMSGEVEAKSVKLERGEEFREIQPPAPLHAEAYGQPPLPPPIVSTPASSSTIIQAAADTSLRSLLMRPVSSSGSSGNLASLYNSGGPSGVGSSSQQQQFLAAASARPPLPPVVMNPYQQPQQQQPSAAVSVATRTKSALPLGLHFQLMRPTIYLFEFFSSWQRHLTRLSITKKSDDVEVFDSATLNAIADAVKTEPGTVDRDERRKPFFDLKKAKRRGALHVSKKLDLYELETALFCFLFTPLSTLKSQLVENDVVERMLAGILQSLQACSNVSLFEQFMTSCYVLQMLPIWLRDEISEACQLVRTTSMSSALTPASKSQSLHQVFIVNSYARFCVRFSVKSLFTELNFLALHPANEPTLAVSDRKDAKTEENYDASNGDKIEFRSTSLFTVVEVEMLDALFRRRICITPFNVMKMASWFKLLSFSDDALLLREILHLYFHQFGQQWLRSTGAKNSSSSSDAENPHQQLNSLNKPAERWRWTIELCLHQPIDDFPQQLKLLESPIILLPTSLTPSGLPVYKIMLFFRFESKAPPSDAGEIDSVFAAAETERKKPDIEKAPVIASGSIASTTNGENAAEKGSGKKPKESAKKRKKREQAEAAAAAAVAAAGLSGKPAGNSTAVETVSTSSESSGVVAVAAPEIPTTFGKPRIFYLPVRYEVGGQTAQASTAAAANVVVQISDEQIQQQPLLSRVRQTYSTFTQAFSANNSVRGVAGAASGAPEHFKLVHLFDAIARNPLI